MAEHEGPVRSSAVGGLWKRTLEQVPTEYGKLVYLTSLRNSDTGRYEHHGLSLGHGADASHFAIQASHERVFREWLATPLPQQAEDLGAYLDELPFDRATLLETWGQLEPYRNLCPVDTAEPERALFCSDLETILTLLRNGRGGGLPSIS
jgi:hypothetical protein